MDTNKILEARLTIFDTPVKFQVNTYVDGDRTALTLITDDEFEEPWATLTVNIPNATIEEDEILVKAWSENEKVAEVALQTGLFEDTGKRVPTGYEYAQVWKLLC